MRKGPGRSISIEDGPAPAAFLRDGLGHGRSFSLDTDDDLRRRAGCVRS